HPPAAGPAGPAPPLLAQRRASRPALRAKPRGLLAIFLPAGGGARAALAPLLLPVFAQQCPHPPFALTVPRRVGPARPRSRQTAVCKIFCFPCWNSASLMTPWSCKSASLASSSAVPAPFPCADSWT